jgi:hypothetical protein
VCAALDGFYRIAEEMNAFNLPPRTMIWQALFQPLKIVMNHPTNLLWLDRDINQMVRYGV